MRKTIALILALGVLIGLALVATSCLAQPGEPDQPPAGSAPATVSPVSPSVAPGPDRLGLAHGEADASELSPRNQTVERLVAAANRIAGQPGHDGPGAVSRVLHEAGLLATPESSPQELRESVKPGPGRLITIVVCEDEDDAYLDVAKLRFDVDASGPGWRPPPWDTRNDCKELHHPGRL